MSISQPFWDADTQGWSGGAWGGMGTGRRRPRIRPARRRGRPRLWTWLRAWLRARRDRIAGNKVPAHWNQATQGWDTGAQDATAARPAAWPRRWTTLTLLLVAAASALLAGWWAGVVFLVWAHLVRTGVAAVRGQAPWGAGALAGRPHPTRVGTHSAQAAAAHSTPGRAFAEGVLAALVPARTLGAEPVPIRPFLEPLPGEGDPVEVEEAVREVLARIAATSARSDEDTPRAPADEDTP
ncbi:hypothetical protein ACGFYP_12365 [Streptomyces sp. NPDC048370]|uniref:hypothetical protein n=1 Tax=Streptomyces sp. NPDC048370 TaxID=3365540 RepID=UPI00370FB685